MTRQPGGQREVLTITANTTLTNSDVGKIITNRGATGAVVITLPAAGVGNLGGSILVMATADQNLTVTTTDNLVTINDLAADSVAFSTTSQKIGGGWEFISDGVAWHALVLGSGGTQTTTVAT